MENAGTGDAEFSSWEIIPEPYYQQENPPSLSSCTQPEDLYLNVLSVRDNFYTTSHALYQWLEEAGSDRPAEAGNSFSSSSSSDEFQGNDDDDSPRSDSNKIKVLAQIGTKLRDLSTMIAVTASNLYSELTLGEKFWSTALRFSLMSATAVSLIYARMIWQQNRALQESRNRLVNLLRERDRKISQLLMRITQLNEIASARRRIPVVVHTV